MKSVIGISCLSHDAAIAVINQDQIAFASQAERYSRHKNDKYLNAPLLIAHGRSEFGPRALGNRMRYAILMAVAEYKLCPITITLISIPC